jgi:hypothetical protein
MQIFILMPWIVLSQSNNKLLSDSENKQIDKALLKLMMTRKDAEFAKIYKDDPTILPMVKTIISSPFEAPDISSYIHQIAVSSAKPSDLLLLAVEILNIKVDDTPSSDKTLSHLNSQTNNEDSNVGAGSKPAQQPCEQRIATLCSDSNTNRSNDQDLIKDTKLKDLPKNLMSAIMDLTTSIDEYYPLFQKSYKNLEHSDLEFIMQKFSFYLDPGINENIDDKTVEAEMKKIKETIAKTDMKSILSSSLDIIKKAEEFDKKAATIIIPEKSEFNAMVFSKSWGNLYIGTKADDRYVIDKPSVIVDFGGDDHYIFKGDLKELGFCLVLDLGGNDIYEYQNPQIGFNMIIDSAGDDLYKGDKFCIGSGILGVSILWDESGNDIYTSDFASQGFGAAGIGILIDNKGNDHYIASALSQGVSSFAGFALLLDRSGNDSYNAGGKYPDSLRDPNYYISMSQGFALGMRNFISGGMGVLIDDDGSDCYNAGIFGQGAGYWHSTGILWDNSGNDNYISHQYSQGCGIHSGSGILVDISGVDSYNSYSQAQGCGYDLSVGFLIDKSGNDSYFGEKNVQGAGIHNSFAFFMDSSGTDRYISDEDLTSQGYADFYRDFGGIGIFIDLSGKDIIIPQKKKEADFWSLSPYGIGYDGE